ncbi:MAG: DUF4433 domain-containing protein [Dissulfuribacterales bacterium]
MTTPPEKPKIYHITHVDNLASIIEANCIESDRLRSNKGQGQEAIGMTEIKRRRLFEIRVSCYTNSMVGDFVPFYFCPHSIMLFIIHKGNHVDMEYHGGQSPILHLQADMELVIHWAEHQDVNWAFTDRNAGSYYADFFNRREDLNNVDWAAVRSTDFRDPMVKEGKQAEFLIHETFPWHLIEKIGVIDSYRKAYVEEILQHALHKPIVKAERRWYY